ncbi:Binding partner of ACD11 1 [Capsicum annuum]|uniref:binding partner of ACD11 1-like n=1 Tax=Capsicum annuum TaxID=4072 RepID=UPI0007BF4A15|nr:binding partner of ACD11 1-like [Capsicum annuum]KAF3639853.1 Binding partner of ACD11 1 [Capsicum annuum]KAF3640497.1 Binding partner of ACD11 1 [Capsicum annuum]
MSVKTVQVSNVSLGAKEQDIKDFFSFSGDIEYLEMKGENEVSQVAYVSFKDPQSAETAVLLSGATIVDQSISIALAPEYKPPPTASVSPAPTGSTNAPAAESAIQKAEDVVSSMLAKGFILGKDAVGKAKALDEKHKITSTTSATVASIDQKYGLSEKITTGATIVNHKVKEMDQKFQVSEKSKSAFAAAEQTVSSAGSAIMKNRYALTGVTWAAGALSRVTKAAGEVGQKTKEKLAEEERRTFARGHAQENAATSAKGEVQLLAAAPAKGDVQQLAAASAKSDVQELTAATSAKQEHPESQTGIEESTNPSLPPKA